MFEIIDDRRFRHTKFSWEVIPLVFDLCGDLKITQHRPSKKEYYVLSTNLKFLLYCFLCEYRVRQS